VANVWWSGMTKLPWRPCRPWGWECQKSQIWTIVNGNPCCSCTFSLLPIFLDPPFLQLSHVLPVLYYLFVILTQFIFKFEQVMLTFLLRVNPSSLPSAPFSNSRGGWTMVRGHSRSRLDDCEPSWSFQMTNNHGLICLWPVRSLSPTRLLHSNLLHLACTCGTCNWVFSSFWMVILLHVSSLPLSVLFISFAHFSAS
jgi:hypothetical protein